MISWSTRGANRSARWTIVAYVSSSRLVVLFRHNQVWEILLHVSVQQRSRICEHRYKRSMSGNITFTKSVKWSATDSERLCSVTNSSKSTSAFLTADDDYDFTAKNDVWWPGENSHHRRQMQLPLLYGTPSVLIARYPGKSGHMLSEILLRAPIIYCWCMIVFKYYWNV